MSGSFDRAASALRDRLNMMLSRGVLRSTDDGSGGQTMQVSALAGELLDGVERFQSFGVSAVPPNGSEVVVGFLGGNRDHGIVLALNDRGSRPQGLATGETVLYSAHGSSVLLRDGNEIVIRAKTLVIEIEETIEIKAGTSITLRSPAINMEQA